MEILNYLKCLDFLEAEGLNVDLNMCMPAEESQAFSKCTCEQNDSQTVQKSTLRPIGRRYITSLLITSLVNFIDCSV